LINTSQKQPLPSDSLIRFLQTKIGLSDEAINLGIRQADLEQAPLPIVLWSFGLLSLRQYETVLDWENNL
tara:strand:+ start:1545 stop:1754 length:210 start_codon:yes stop_codon:yes gene_type:complete